MCVEKQRKKDVGHTVNLQDRERGEEKWIRLQGAFMQHCPLPVQSKNTWRSSDAAFNGRLM